MDYHSTTETTNMANKCQCCSKKLVLLLCTSCNKKYCLSHFPTGLHACPYLAQKEAKFNNNKDGPQPVATGKFPKLVDKL